MTLVRQLEEVVEARQEAEKWAGIGLQAKGLQLLRSGLSRAEESEDPWKEQLVDHWLAAMDEFERKCEARATGTDHYARQVRHG